MDPRSTGPGRPDRATLDRRTWLKAAGAGLLAMPALAADKPRTNVRLGVDGGPYAGLPVEEAARRIKADGFSSLLCHYQFADARFDPLEPDWEAAKKIVSALDRHGISVAAVFAYHNVVDPHEEQRKKGRDRMLAAIANWKRMGNCPYVCTETGTFNAASEWEESPENQTEEGYRKCRDAFAVLVRAAEKSGAVVAIEPYWKNVIGSIDRAERLFRDIDSPALKLVMDPCNYYRKEDLPRMKPMLEEMFRRLGDRIVVAHAKDVKASADGTDLPASGLGVLDYPLYLRLLERLNRPMPLLVEHVDLAGVPRARDYVKGHLDRRG